MLESMLATGLISLEFGYRWATGLYRVCPTAFFVVRLRLQHPGDHIRAKGGGGCILGSFLGKAMVEVAPRMPSLLKRCLLPWTAGGSC